MYSPKLRPESGEETAGETNPDSTFMPSWQGPLLIDAQPDNATAANRIRTLVVDNDARVREAFETVLRDEGYEVCCAASSAEAREMLHQTPFDVLLCDLFMPEKSGLELLRETVRAFPDMPVILLSGQSSAHLVREALHEGASDFITKPCNPGELPVVVERNLTRQAVQRKNALRHRIALHTSNESVLDALLSALNTRDTETEGHSERVTAYTMEMADMMGLSLEAMYHIERGALLHDIGKIGIPDRILLKPSKLTSEEWVEMRKHPIIGYRMCSRIQMLKTASEIVLHHHEAWDGSGYPNGLLGESIPLGARIFAIADTLDAMTSDRPYRAALSFSIACEEIEKHSGKQFDPSIVEVFLSVPKARWQHIRSLAGQ